MSLLQILSSTAFENYMEKNLLLFYSVLKNRFQQHLDIYKVNMDQVLLFSCVIKQFSFLIFSTLSQINRGSKITKCDRKFFEKSEKIDKVFRRNSIV